MPVEKPKRKRASKAKQTKSPARRVTKAAQRAEMTEQILDVAEELFSRHGLYGVTLKDVAKRVGVHHTLMNYYFTDKKKLFDEVFARRAVVTSTRRMNPLRDSPLSRAARSTSARMSSGNEMAILATAMVFPSVWKEYHTRRCGTACVRPVPGERHMRDA